MTLDRRTAAAAAGALLALLLAGAGMVTWVAGDRDDGDWQWTLPVAAVYGTAGVLLARRAGRLAVVFLVMAVSAGASLLSGEHAGAVAAGRSEVGGALAVWVSSWSWVPSYLLLAAVLPHVLPDGVPLRGRWRWGYLLGVAAVAVGTLGWAVCPYDELDEASEAALALGVDNPVGIQGAGLLVGASAGLAVAAAAWGVVSLVVRRRRAEDRSALDWVLGGVATTVLVLLLAQAAPAGSSGLVAVAVLPLPAAVVIAVLRHGLWDPELALRRALVWLLLSVVLAGAFVAVVALLGDALGDRVGAPVVAAAIVALIASPLRDRLQAAMSRLLYGGGADPYDAVRRTGARLAAVTSPEAALGEACAAVAAALDLPAVRISVVGGSVHEHGDPAALTAGSSRLPLLHAGQVVGELVAARRRPRVPLREADLRLLASLSQQAGAVAHAAQLDTQLQQVRASLVLAQEEERRRLRHDLHDSLGPALAGVALQLEGLPCLLTADPGAAAALAQRLTARVQDAVADVRQIIEGLGPDDGLGLAEALRAQVDGFDALLLSASLVIDPEAVGGLPAAVERAAVRVVGEALANAARHAGADRCTVRVLRDAEGLRIVVSDNGMGVSASRAAGTTSGSGVGLLSMATVAGEIGGSCAVVDAEGGGTEVRLVLPVQRT